MNTHVRKGLLFEAGQHDLYVRRFSGQRMKGSLQSLSLGVVLRQLLNPCLHVVEPLVDRVHVIDEHFSRLLYGFIHLDAHLVIQNRGAQKKGHSFWYCVPSFQRRGAGSHGRDSNISKRLDAQLSDLTG